MTVSSRLHLVDPTSLPCVWRGEDLASEGVVLPTGHALLDFELPGHGWPVGGMVEVLEKHAGQHVWQLLLPGLVQATSNNAGPVVLVGPPYQPFGPSLRAQGLAPERLLWVKADKSAARLWACEQALRCGEVSAVLAWLPQARNAELRRLHMAGQQNGQLLFVFRSMNARHDASPARLRLSVEGVDTLELRILKRRGPPLESSLTLTACSSRMAALLDSRKGQGLARPAESSPASHRRSHVLDRAAAFT